MAKAGETEKEENKKKGKRRKPNRGVDDEPEYPEDAQDRQNLKRQKPQ